MFTAHPFSHALHSERIGVGCLAALRDRLSRLPIRCVDPCPSRTKGPSSRLSAPSARRVKERTKPKGQICVTCSSTPPAVRGEGENPSSPRLPLSGEKTCPPLVHSRPPPVDVSRRNVLPSIGQRIHLASKAGQRRGERTSLLPFVSLRAVEATGRERRTSPLALLQAEDLLVLALISPPRLHPSSAGKDWRASPVAAMPFSSFPSLQWRVGQWKRERERETSRTGEENDLLD